MCAPQLHTQSKTRAWDVHLPGQTFVLCSNSKVSVLFPCVNINSSGISTSELCCTPLLTRNSHFLCEICCSLLCQQSQCSRLSWTPLVLDGNSPRLFVYPFLDALCSLCHLRRWVCKAGAGRKDHQQHRHRRKRAKTHWVYPPRLTWYLSRKRKAKGLK